MTVMVFMPVCFLLMQCPSLRPFVGIAQVVPIYLLGDFNHRKYKIVNRNAKQEMAPPRPGKFDDEGYR